jgi:hypothetical protein
VTEVELMAAALATGAAPGLTDTGPGAMEPERRNDTRARLDAMNSTSVSLLWTLRALLEQSRCGVGMAEAQLPTRPRRKRAGWSVRKVHPARVGLRCRPASQVTGSEARGRA